MPVIKVMRATDSPVVTIMSALPDFHSATFKMVNHTDFINFYCDHKVNVSILSVHLPVAAFPAFMVMGHLVLTWMSAF